MLSDAKNDPYNASVKQNGVVSRLPELEEPRELLSQAEIKRIQEYPRFQILENKIISDFNTLCRDFGFKLSYFQNWLVYMGYLNSEGMEKYKPTTDINYVFAYGMGRVKQYLADKGVPTGTEYRSPAQIQSKLDELKKHMDEAGGPSKEKEDETGRAGTEDGQHDAGGRGRGEISGSLREGEAGAEPSKRDELSPVLHQQTAERTAEADEEVRQGDGVGSRFGSDGLDDDPESDFGLGDTDGWESSGQPVSYDELIRDF